MDFNFKNKSLLDTLFVIAGANTESEFGRRKVVAGFRNIKIALTA